MSVVLEFCESSPFAFLALCAVSTLGLVGAFAVMLWAADR